MGFVFVVFGFFAAIVMSELVLRGTKLQTGLTKVLGVHILVAGSLVLYLILTYQFRAVAFFIFWAGAFLTWFGARSHIESSILLRMIYLLRRGPTTEARLLEEYESQYGETLRLKELFHGKLLEQTPEGIVPTSKGRFILRIVSFLK